jgi:UDP-N-acetylglucosamine 2-epimerase
MRRQYLLATVHRSENTDVRDRLAGILNAFNALRETILFPVHPRTRKAIANAGLVVNSNVKMIDPVGYLEMVALSDSARMVLTDSGGLQKEAFWLGVPCVTLREQTEWVETVDAGWNTLVGSDMDKIIEAVEVFSPAGARPNLYGEGCVAAKCVALLGETSRSH